MENLIILLVLNNLIMLLFTVVQCEDSVEVFISRISHMSEYIITVDYVPFLVWVALQELHHKNFGQGKICGGSVITQRVVLTSAHCFHISSSSPARYKDPSLYIVVAGGSYSDHPDRFTREFPIEAIVGHSEFNPETLHNDIALLFLNGFVAKNLRTVKIVHLTDNPPKSGDKCVISGWGHSENVEQPSLLQQAQISIWDQENCSQFYSWITDALMCAGYGSGALCVADYGGPLVCDGGVAGILTWDTRCGVNSPGIFTNISYYFKWIQDINSTFDYSAYYKFHSTANWRRKSSNLIVSSLMALFIIIIYGF